MAASAATQPFKQSALPTAGNKPKHVSWENFEKRYLPREDGFKYEWVRGAVIKTENSINQKQLFILANLRDFFNQLVFSGKIEGYLEPEVDTFFIKGESYRRPDLSFFTKKQQALAAHGVEQIPQFVVEVVKQ